MGRPGRNRPGFLQRQPAAAVRAAASSSQDVRLPQAPYQQQYGAAGRTKDQQPYDRTAVRAGQAALQQQYDGGWDTSQQTAMPYGGSPAAGYGGTPPATAVSSRPTTTPPPRRIRRRSPRTAASPSPSAAADAGQWDPRPRRRRSTPSSPARTATTPTGTTTSPARAESCVAGATTRGNERRGKGKKKGRNGCACLVVSLVLFGGLGGVSYFGYQFWQDKFGAPDGLRRRGQRQHRDRGPARVRGLAGDRQHPEEGRGRQELGRLRLRSAQGKSVQAGVYILPKEMSGANAVEAMLDPKSRNNLIVPPGKRNVWVYAEIDKRLELKEGTTAAVAKTQAKIAGPAQLGQRRQGPQGPAGGLPLPGDLSDRQGDEAGGRPQEDGRRGEQGVRQDRPRGEAAKLGLKSPLELITVASLVQAEGKYKHDFDKVSRVVYNRLKENNTETMGRLEFDSTVNYIKGQSKLDIGVRREPARGSRTRTTPTASQGLPPGPIGNPGQDALSVSAQTRRPGRGTTSSPSPRRRPSSRRPTRSTSAIARSTWRSRRSRDQ